MREEDIIFENSKAWVGIEKAKARYTVFVHKTTHSESDSSYALDDDGLSLAVSRAHYIETKKSDAQFAMNWVADYAARRDGKTSEMTVNRFQQIASALLKKHYLLELGDTLLTEENIVAECIAQGRRPFEIIAEHAREADLDRLDIKGHYGVPPKDAITAADEDAVLQQLPPEASPLHELTDDQRGALIDFRRLHGRRWKGALENFWMGSHCSAPLQQIRNDFGPQWLQKLKPGDFPPAAAPVIAPRRERSSSLGMG